MLCSNGIVIAKHIFFYQKSVGLSDQRRLSWQHIAIQCLDHILISRNSCFIPQKLIKQGFQVNEIVEPFICRFYAK